MNGSEPAFPETKIIGMHGEMVGTANTSGISTRLYVATQIMAAMFSHNVIESCEYESVARKAKRAADALIAACKEKPHASNA